MTIRYYVILSKAKDLKVFVTVTGPINCEILRFVQDDNPSHSSSLRGGLVIYRCQRDKRDERGVRDKREERDERNESNKRNEKEHTGNS